MAPTSGLLISLFGHWGVRCRVSRGKFCCSNEAGPPSPFPRRWGWVVPSHCQMALDNHTAITLRSCGESWPGKLLKNFRLMEPPPYRIWTTVVRTYLTSVFSKKGRTWPSNAVFVFPGHLSRFSVHSNSAFLYCEHCLFVLLLSFYNCASFCILFIGYI